MASAEEVERLLIEHIDDVAVFVKKYRAPAGMTFDEYYSEMFYGMYLGARAFDVARGTFSAYAFQCMRLRRGKMCAHMCTGKARLHRSHALVLDGEIVEFPSPKSRCLASDNETNSLVTKLMSHLSDVHRAVVRYRMDGVSFPEIAKLTGAKSLQVVTCRHIAALKIMRRTARLTGITAASVGL